MLYPNFPVAPSLRNALFKTGSPTTNADSGFNCHFLAQFVLQVIFCVSLLMYAASPTKLLLLTEKLKPEDKMSAGDTLFLFWNFIAAAILDVSWRYYFSRTPSSYVQLDEYDDEEELAPKQTFELIFRLLQYCKREWIWHLSGFSWLFLYSITRIFVPFFTGKVIATVVATHSYPALANAVYVMTVISIVR